MATYSLTKLQNLSLKWLILFTLICLINALIPFFAGFGYVHIAVLIPFIHFGLLVVIGIVRGLAFLWNLDTNLDCQYLKSHYPEIWRRMHPVSDMVLNNFADIKFIIGGYDDGSDEILNAIKYRWRFNWIMIAWAFALVPINFLFALGSAWIGNGTMQ